MDIIAFGRVGARWAAVLLRPQGMRGENKATTGAKARIISLRYAARKRRSSTVEHRVPNIIEDLTG
jgi:hypothetical protein